jgi:serine/threonine protein kinase
LFPDCQLPIRLPIVDGDDACVPRAAACYDLDSKEPSTLVDESSAHGAPSAFGTYRVLHQIGSGVLGPVFRGLDPQRDRIVAIKAFRLDLLPEDVARVAAALRRLVTAGFTHPHHVTLVDAGLEGTTPFLVSEYVAGETLDVARRQMASAPAGALVPWLRQVAAAVDAAHRGGLRHGALHPRDVLIVGQTSDATVTGFGIVGVLDAVGVRLPVRRPYTAPERTSGDPWDIRADVYSIAAIAHELLTGRRPAGPGEQDGALAGGLSPEQRVAVRKTLATGLAERPEMRFDSAAALMDALEAAVAGGPIAVVAAGPIPVAAGAESVPAPAPVGPETGEDPASIESVVMAVPAAPSPIPEAAIPAPPLPLATPASAYGRLDSPPPNLVPPPAAPRYPWSAIAAVALASLIAGVALGYHAGLGRTTPTSPAPQAMTSAAPSASDTEVAVARESAAPPSVEDATRPEAIEPRPERATAPTGHLTVRSDPTGALVTIDGRLRGETPVTVRDLGLGPHTIQIARPGHVPWTQRVTLTVASPSRLVAATLRPGLDAPVRISGSIYVDSRPRGARVRIDGRFVGTTPFRISGMAAGRHDLRFELDGYRPATTAVSVGAGRESRAAVTLEPGAALPGGRGPVR